MFSSRLCPFAIALVACALNLPCNGDEPASSASDQTSAVDLLSPASLARWNPQFCDAAGWKLAEGKLIGTTDAVPLACNCALGDFDLYITWAVTEAGAIKLKLPAGDESKSVELRLAEVPGISIRMPQAARSLKIPEQARGKVHSMVVHRLGDKFSLAVDGVRSRELPVDPSERFALVIAVEAGKATIQSLRVVELREVVGDK